MNEKMSFCPAFTKVIPHIHDIKIEVNPITPILGYIFFFLVSSRKISANMSMNVAFSVWNITGLKAWKISYGFTFGIFTYRFESIPKTYCKPRSPTRRFASLVMLFLRSFENTKLLIP